MRKVKYSLLLVLALGAFTLSSCDIDLNKDDATNVTGENNNEDIDDTEEETIVFEDVSFKYTLNSTNDSYSVVLNNENDYSNVKAIKIPESYNGLPVTVIGENAFRNCSKLRTIDIPNTIIKIENNAFRGCKNLRDLVLPSNITTLGETCFYGCKSLLSVTLPRTLTSIDATSFQSCNKLVEIYNLSSIDLSSHVVAIYAKKINTSLDEQSIIDKDGYYKIAYYNDSHYIVDYVGKNTKLELPDSIKYKGETINQYKIRSYAFYGTDVTELNLSKAVTSFSTSAVEDNSKITKIVVNENNPVYDSRNNCNAIINSTTDILLFGCKNTTIPNGVKRITATFDNCVFDNLVIPDSVEYISRNSFKNAEIRNYQKYNNGYYVGNSSNQYYFCFKLDESTATELHPDCKVYADTTKHTSSISIPQGIKSISKLGYYSSVTYGGTIDEWNNLYKPDSWGFYLTTTVITCSNGNVDVPSFYDDIDE